MSLWRLPCASLQRLSLRVSCAHVVRSCGSHLARRHVRLNAWAMRMEGRCLARSNLEKKETTLNVIAGAGAACDVTAHGEATLRVVAWFSKDSSLKHDLRGLTLSLSAHAWQEVLRWHGRETGGECTGSLAVSLHSLALSPSLWVGFHQFLCSPVRHAGHGRRHKGLDRGRRQGERQDWCHCAEPVR